MSRLRRYLDQRFITRVQRHWAQVTARAETLPLADVRLWRDAGPKLRAGLDDLQRASEERLNRVAWARSGTPRLPGVDWAWRPSLWTAALPEANQIGPPSGVRLGAHVALHHDCEASRVCLRQRPGRAGGQGAAYAFSLEAYDFDGSYASLVIDVPEEGLQGLMLRHLLRFDAIIAVEHGNDLWARLNIRHGPNHEQLAQHLPISAGRQTLSWDFDLGYLQLNEKRIEAVWLDLLFQPPRMNEIVLEDMVLSRRPRAAL